MDGKRIWQQGRHWLAGLMVVALAACGGSGGGSTYVPPAGPNVSNAVVSTYAGALDGTDGTGTAATFSGPRGGVVVAGNLYVADRDNKTIRKIVIKTGEVSTFAGSTGISGYDNGTGTAARFYSPASIASDGSNLYVADSGGHSIRKIVIATREVTTLAGSTTGERGSSNGIGNTASFSAPTGITLAGDHLYVTDNGNHTIRKIVIATGEVGTLAGLAGSSGNTDATGDAARFYGPDGISSDGTNLYVADTSNHTIRKIVISSGAVSTLAGGVGGNSDGTGTEATFYYPAALTYDNGNLYVAGLYNHSIRKIVINTGVVSTFAGAANSYGNTDGTGAAARFKYPQGIVSDGTRLYVSDAGNATIRTIEINTAAVTPLAGKPYGADGIGQAARFSWPSGFATDGSNLYVADMNNHTIRKVVIATGEVTTFAGSTGVEGKVDGVGAAASFDQPVDITSDGTYLYVVDSGNKAIRKIEIKTATVSTLAGGNYSYHDDGTGTAAGFARPHGIVKVGGDLYVTENGSYTIRKIVIATGVVTTFAGTAGSSGNTDGIGTSAQFNTPNKICSDGSNLYVADGGYGTIRKIVIATGAVSTIAGKGMSSVDVDGIGIAARFSYPIGITTDGTHLYITDANNSTIRRLTIATGQVSTIAGLSRKYGNTDGTGSAARFHAPYGIISIGSTLYVADTLNNTIRTITGF